VLREETEAEIRYQAALKNHLQYIWRLRGTYPNQAIPLWDDNISGAFNHRTFYPDTARVNSGIFQDQIMISTGMHFGGNFGPSNQEPVAWARCELAEHLFQHETYQIQLNKHLQDIIQIDATMQLPTSNPKSAKLDSLNLPWPEN
jgi:hypothetical protein